MRKLESVSAKEQRERGMYMIGQVAGMRGEVTSVKELHDTVCDPASQRLAEPRVVVKREQRKHEPSDIAIIGMGCNYPGAPDLETYWQNILKRQYAVTEVPASHWDWRLYYDPDPKTPDRIISKWGGFLSDVPFDPMRYGITPKSMEVIEPLQLLVLESVRHALADAGYEHRPFNRERTAAILGIGGGGGPMSIAYGFRTCMRVVDYIDGMPIESDDILKLAHEQLPEWTEDSFPGMLGNVCAGRVANRFNLGGPNYAIDAACASSLASLDCCVRELELGTADMAIAMGADAVQTPLAYMAFSKTHALSASGRIRPFDAEGDGIVLSEGIGVVILKRLADAQRDGDRVYAIIKGVGSSSDGKEKGLTAPNTTGQQRALRRAYEKANVSPDSVGLVEAHGTGTVVGDQTEANSLSNFMKDSGAATQSCALGSVKSMIGHSKCAAGVAGLIKSTLALHHKTLPATLVETPNPKAKFDESALFLNTETRPWIRNSDQPRVAGVSAFGFGGTNFHTVLEEYEGDYLQSSESVANEWPSELFVWRRASAETIVAEGNKLIASLGAMSDDSELTLASAAAAVSRRNVDESNAPVLSIVAKSFEDLKASLETAIEKISTGVEQFSDPRGIFFRRSPQFDGKVAFLFPGQGSQYPNMLAETAFTFPRVRQALDSANVQLAGRFDRPLSQYIYPPSAFSDDQRNVQAAALSQTEIAQPALGAVSVGMMHLLSEFGLKPDAVGGHSYGEYVALACAGVLSEENLSEISFLRGQVISDASSDTESGMLAVDANESDTKKILKRFKDATLANINSPAQTVISVATSEMDAIEKAFQSAGIRVRRIPVSLGFHSPFVADASERLGKHLSEFEFAAASIDFYSNTSGSKLDVDPNEIPATLSEHLCSPVRFVDEVNGMYEAGVRAFIEVGPNHVLTNLTKQILGEREHLAVASDVKGRSGLTQLLHCLGQLATYGVAVDLERLYSERTVAQVNLDRLEIGAPEYPKNYWMVNGVRSKPIQGDEPLLLGQPPRSVTDRTGADRTATQGQNGVHDGSTANGKVAMQPTGAKTSPAVAPSIGPSIASTQTTNAKMPASTTEQTTAAGKSALRAASVKSSATGSLPNPQSRPQQNRASGTAPMPRPNSQTKQNHDQPAKQQPVSHDTSKVNRQMNNGKQTGPGSPPSYGSGSAEVDQCDLVMQGFQQVMAKFLDTQRDVMMSYLQGDDYVAPETTSTTIGHVQNGAASSQVAAPAPAPIRPQPSGEQNGHADLSNAASSNDSPPNASSPNASSPNVAAQNGASTNGASPNPPADSTNGVAASNGAGSNNNGHADPTASKAVDAAANRLSKEPVSTEVIVPTNAIAEPAGLSRDVVSEKLLNLVSERTGYPTDMLDPDLDLEADLGVDSIKRVEILGSLAEFITPEDQAGDETDINLETLSGLRTLRLIMDYLEETLPMGGDSGNDTGSEAGNDTGSEAGNDTGSEAGNDASSDAAPNTIAMEDPSQKKKPLAGESKDDSPDELTQSSASQETANAIDDSLVIKRGLVSLVDAPIPSGGDLLMPAGAVVITADNRGIATECADRLADYGLAAVVIQHDPSAIDVDSGYAADLTDATSVQSLISRLRNEVGRIAGIIHLLPVGELEAGTSENAGSTDSVDGGGNDWADRASTDVRSIYLLSRELESDLCESGAAGGAFVLASTMMGGLLGFGDEQMESLMRVGAGGANGFLKCVGMEWPDVLVRSIDFHHEATASEVVDCLQAELGDGGGPFEVGYRGGRRVTLGTSCCRLLARMRIRKLRSIRIRRF